MAQTTTRAPQQQARPAQSQGQVAVIAPPRLLPPAEAELKTYEIDPQGWRTLVETIFPAAKTPSSVMMALDYCRRRKLDIFKHPVHIVPIWNSQAGPDGKGGYVETIWPGINELRTTAIRTGQYAGMDVPVFGPTITHTFKGRIKKWAQGGSQWETVEATVQFPEWCQITVYRLLGGNRVPFPGPRVYWLETYSRLRNDCEVPNSMWEKRANGQLEKCAEGAALRRAFPEELGSDYSIDEIGAFTTHAPTDVTNEGSVTTAAPAPEPQRDDPKYQAASPDAPAPSSGKPEDGREPAQAGQAEDNPAAEQTGTSAPPVASKKPRAKKEDTKPPVTDVQDMNEQAAADTTVGTDEDMAFEQFNTARAFCVWSDEWLKKPGRTAEQANAWEKHYRDGIAGMQTHDYKSVRERIAETLKIYHSVIGHERQPGEEG